MAKLSEPRRDFVARRSSWQHQARLLKREVYALYFAVRDPRVPWYAKALAGCVVAYALSPIDLIPDPIPVLGYLDDLVLVPLGVLAVRRMIPDHVMTECRFKAQELTTKPTNWIAAVVIVLIWLALAAAGTYWLVSALSAAPDQSAATTPAASALHTRWTRRPTSGSTSERQAGDVTISSPSAAVFTST
jgi:uncharacterized membrane protein YkvA (DUF1232 family)